MAVFTIGYLYMYSLGTFLGVDHPVGVTIFQKMLSLIWDTATILLMQILTPAENGCCKMDEQCPTVLVY